MCEAIMKYRVAALLIKYSLGNSVNVEYNKIFILDKWTSYKYWYFVLMKGGGVTHHFTFKKKNNR